MQAISVRKTKPQRGKNHSEGAIYFQASVFLQHKGNKLITLAECLTQNPTILKMLGWKFTTIFCWNLSKFQYSPYKDEVRVEVNF